MEQTILIENRIKEIFAHDPLYLVIKETPTEQFFLSEPYLSNLIEKKFYSTPEVASWFDVTDAQIRYYIKPFEEYLFDDEESNPTTASVIRLDFKAVLKLRMILLLKDEYRVKGLKQLLRINKDGHIVKKRTSTTTEVGMPDNIEYRLSAMSQALEQIMKTGLFKMEQDEETKEMQLSLNYDFFKQEIKALPPEPSQELTEVQVATKKLEQENTELKIKVEEIMASNKEDIAIRIREKAIEQLVLSRLQNEAVQQYSQQKKPTLFQKLFRSAQLEVDKKLYIAAYIEEKFTKQLTQALLEYHEQSLSHQDE